MARARVHGPLADAEVDRSLILWTGQPSTSSGRRLNVDPAILALPSVFPSGVTFRFTGRWHGLRAGPSERGVVLLLRRRTMTPPPCSPLQCAPCPPCSVTTLSATGGLVHRMGGSRSTASRACIINSRP